MAKKDLEEKRAALLKKEIQAKKEIVRNLNLLREKSGKPLITNL